MTGRHKLGCRSKRAVPRFRAWHQSNQQHHVIVQCFVPVPSCHVHTSYHICNRPLGCSYVNLHKKHYRRPVCVAFSQKSVIKLTTLSQAILVSSPMCRRKAKMLLVAAPGILGLFFPGRQTHALVHGYYTPPTNLGRGIATWRVGSSGEDGKQKRPPRSLTRAQVSSSAAGCRIACNT